MISILARISSGSAVNNFETTRIRKDGTLFPVSLTISPIRDENGTVVAASVIYRDVSELKQAAQYNRSLIEASLDPLETISPDGKITDVNEAAVKVTGIPRNKLIGSDFSSYFTDPDKAREGYQRVFDQGSVTHYPLTVRHTDGTLTDVLCNTSLYRDTGGNVIGVFAAARDMTSQKEGFEAAQRMAAIAEYSDDAIISNTLDGIITSWNPAAERMFGYSSQEIVGQSGSLLSPQDRIGELKDILAKVSQGRPVDNFETICTRKDGTTFPVKVTLTPIRDAGGTIVGASAIARDVYAIARHMPEQT
jgi:PAS domain S-box-containing protein